MTQADYIDALKNIAQRPSVYAVAQLLEMDETTIRSYAKGRRHFDSYAATRIAELLDVPPMQIIADIEAEREGDEKRRVYWKNLARKLAGSTAAIAMVIATCADSYFTQPQNDSTNVAKNATNFILCKIVWAWLRALQKKKEQSESPFYCRSGKGCLSAS